MYKSLVTRLACAKYTSNGDLYFEYFFLVPRLKSSGIQPMLSPILESRARTKTAMTFVFP